MYFCSKQVCFKELKIKFILLILKHGAQRSHSEACSLEKCTLVRYNSGLQTRWAFLTNFINILGPKQQLPIWLHCEKGPYLSIEGAFLKNYGPFSTGPLPELSLHYPIFILFSNVLCCILESKKSG